ncbi:MAG: ABC transporter substrate-binding protein [Bacteroidales bacterium]|nr:ABC transporter substrate-binding protein [Bacteroidales bacterium]
MKKKFLALVTASALALSLAACGGSSSSAASSAPAASGATSGAAGSSSGTFKLGVIGPLTGENAIYGQAVANGAQIAVDEINAEGGAIQFELKSEDDVADGETSVNAYNNLLDWGMQVLVGPTTTGASVAVAAEAYNDRVFMLTPSASSTDVVSGKDNVFQVCFTDPNQGVGAADYMAENMAGSKIAVIYRNDDPYSQGIHDTFVSEAAEKGLEIVYEGTFTADTATDFSVQLTGAQSAGADTVFLPIYYQPASVILNQANAMGYEPTFFGVDGMDGILTMEGFDPALAEGLMLLTPFSATVESNKSFVDAYTAAYGVEPNQFAADAYDGVYIVKQALEAAGCTADMSTADICEALVAQMSQISFDGLTGTSMTWNTEGQVSKAPTAYVIKDGAYVLPEA